LDAADGTAIMAAEVFFTASPMVMRAERGMTTFANPSDRR